MSNLLQLLLLLIGSLALSGFVVLWVIIDANMNKLYKEEIKRKMLDKKFLVTIYVFTTCLFFIVGYIILISE